MATAAVEIAWIADTGASQDLICESLVEPSSIRKAKQPLMLTTANGSKLADKVTSYQVDMLDTQLEPYVLEDTPSVISVGRKCLVDGWDFVWRAFSRPFLRRPDGMTVKMEVHDYVPYIPSTNGTAMTALGMRYEDKPDRTAEADAGCASGRSSETMKVEPAAPVESSVVEGEVPEFEFDPFEYAPETPSEDVKEAPGLPDGERAEEDPDDEKIEEDDEDLMGDEGPPTEAEKDERLKIKPVENQRDMGKEALRREACSLQHLMTHVPKNPFCDSCNRARMTKRTARSHGESKHVKATKFGDHITSDHLINYGERNEGGSGELVAMVFKDVYTDIRYCYPAARKHTRDCVEAMKHFVGPDVEVGIFYSDEAPELKRAASEMKWRHHVGTAYVYQANAVAERNLRSVIEGTRTNLLQSGLNHQYWPYAAKHACMAHNIAEEYEMDSPWKVMKGKRWSGPQIPFGARVDYWTGPKNKVKSSARFDPSSVPGIVLGYPLHPGLIWRGDFLVAPLKSIMDKPFEETVTVIRANNIALPNSGISFPLRLRHDNMREGLWPLPEPPGDPEKRNSSDSSLIPELLEESRKEKKDRIADEAAEFEKSIDEVHERREKGDLAPVGPEASVSDVPKPDEDGVITVLDEKTGKFVKIPAESTSYYSASGYKARKYKGSSKPDSIPTSLWRAASKKARKEAIEKDKLEKARAKHRAAPAVVRDQDGDPVPRMPVSYNHEERRRERIAQTIYQPRHKPLVRWSQDPSALRKSPPIRRRRKLSMWNGKSLSRRAHGITSRWSSGTR